MDRLGSDIRGTKYFPYGAEATATASDRDKFATYYRDASTGLDYADQRYYSSTIGRFLSPDPYEASGGPVDPGSWNRYAYVQGDPINFVDPQGLLIMMTESLGGADGGGGDAGWGGGGGGYFGAIDSGGFGSFAAFNAAMSRLNAVSFYQETPGAGGGGGNGRNIIANNAQKAAVNEGIDEATRRLKDPKCAGFFDRDNGDGYGQDLLNQTEYRVLPFGSGRAGTGAATNGPTSVFINSDGAYFNQNVYGVSRDPSAPFYYADFGTGLTGAAFRALILLHELGHQTGKIGPDAGRGIAPGTNRGNTQRILDNCFQALGGGLYQ
jgi:RHS repeat-associated protein